jgi:ribose transport system permease protein
MAVRTDLSERSGLSQMFKCRATPQSRGNLALLRRNIIYPAFVLMCVAFSFTSPYFATWQNLNVILLEAATTGIVAFGMTFVIVGGDIDLSVGSVYALAAVGAAVLMSHGLAWWEAALLVLLGGLVLGLVNGLLTVKANIPSFLVTLGTLGIGEGIALVISGTVSVPITAHAFNSLFSGNLLGISGPIWWGLAIFLLAWLALSQTVWGRYVLAVGGSRETSRLMGIPVNRIRIQNLLLSAVLAAVAGLIVAARLQSGDPTIGNNFELNVITAVILGGTALFGGAGSIPGTLVGTLIITTLSDGLLLAGVNGNMQIAAGGGILVLTVLLRGA